MMRNSPIQITSWLIVAQAFALGACTGASKQGPAPSTAGQVQLIALSGPIAAKTSELSGLAWHGETLVLLPQYADRANQGSSGAVYALTRAEIQDYLEHKTQAPLAPRMVPFSAPGLREKLPGFEGFESIGFSGDRVFLTIETHESAGMKGYLIAGSTDAQLSKIDLDTEHLAPIAPQAKLGNITDEALIISKESIYTFYEANGLNVNPNPVAHQFTEALEPKPSIPFTHLEYRVTDATPPDDQGRFWVINYFYPKDAGSLKPAPDPLAQRWAPDIPQSTDQTVERLVQLQLTENGIELVDRAPIWLQVPQSTESHNWEGLAPMGKGFLLVTDTYPQTLFGYVQGPE